MTGFSGGSCGSVTTDTGGAGVRVLRRRRRSWRPANRAHPTAFCAAWGAAIWLTLACVSAMAAGEPGRRSPFRAGAAAVDITPTTLPAIVSGGIVGRSAAQVTRPLYARGLVLDDGAAAIAICVVDTLFVPREMCDQIKQAAAGATGIPPERMLIAATHTHSAPSLAGALGTGVDANYARILPGLVVQCLVEAAQRRAAAQAGWAVIDAPQYTHCRQWILRPDRLRYDPFGEMSVRSQMHPGYQNPDFLGPAGPTDPGLTLLSVRSRDGRPLALLANYSMHYFGEQPVSPDYFGVFCQKFEKRVASGGAAGNFVAILSQGTAGDQHWMDYSRPKKDLTLETYTEPLVQLAFAAYEKIRYCDDVPLGMAQTRLTLARRAPDASRLAWARRVLADLGDREPQTWPEVYAREQVLLHQQPRRELLLQAIRIGALGITAIPNEVFAITGLKLKAQSPLVPTMNIELANGAEGYLPPPEQHRLGGYTTWAARSAGLEVQAEPQIVQSVLGLLERVSGKPRRPRIDPPAPYAQAVLKSRPVFYWRLSEFQGVAAGDATGQGHQGTFEGGVALYLDGPASPGFCGPSQVNRAVHLAGGRIRTPLADHGDRYSVELWFCNLLPADAREVAGHLFSRGFDQMMGRAATGGEHLGVGGTRLAPGRLVFYSGAAPQSGDTLTGRTTIVPGSWYHLVLVRDGRQARVYLNGDTAPELAGELAPQKPVDWLFFGGRNDDYANFEGKLDEVAFYGRALGVDEIARHYAAAGIAP